MSLTKGTAINWNLNYEFLIDKFKCSIFTDVSILPDRKIDLPKKFPFHNCKPLNEALMFSRHLWVLGHIKALETSGLSFSMTSSSEFLVWNAWSALFAWLMGFLERTSFQAMWSPMQHRLRKWKIEYELRNQRNASRRISFSYASFCIVLYKFLLNKPLMSWLKWTLNLCYHSYLRRNTVHLRIRV